MCLCVLTISSQLLGTHKISPRTVSNILVHTKSYSDKSKSYSRGYRLHTERERCGNGGEPYLRRCSASWWNVCWRCGQSQAPDDRSEPPPASSGTRSCPSTGTRRRASTAGPSAPAPAHAACNQQHHRTARVVQSWDCSTIQPAAELLHV